MIVVIFSDVACIEFFHLRVDFGLHDVPFVRTADVWGLITLN